MRTKSGSGTGAWNDHGEHRERPDGRYRARWREYPGGPQKTRQFARKGDAARFLDGLRGDLARGLYVDPNGGRVLFREYADQWRAA